MACACMHRNKTSVKLCWWLEPPVGMRMPFMLPPPKGSQETCFRLSFTTACFQEATCTMKIARWEPVAIFPAQGPRAITGLSSAAETKWLVAWQPRSFFVACCMLHVCMLRVACCMSHVAGVAVGLSPPIQGRMFQSWLPTEHVETCAGALGQLGTIRTLWHPSRPLNRPGLGCASIKPGIFAPLRVSHSNDRFG